MAMKPLKTAHDMFYFVEDVMQILGYSKSKSYKVIKSLNRELENQGKCTCDGRVIKRYFHERYGLDELNASARRGGVAMEKSKRRRAYARSYYRLSVLCLAAMVTARLILLMIDVIQLQIQTVGAFSIPASAAILVFTGWELRTWTGQGKEKKSCGPTSVTAAERRLTPESGATARTARPSTTASRSSPRRTSTTPRPR